jgi:hypothetical protein
MSNGLHALRYSCGIVLLIRTSQTHVDANSPLAAIDYTTHAFDVCTFALLVG